MILTKELRRELSKKIDDIIKLPGWAEPFDRLVINYALDYIDENYSDKVPEQFKDDIVKTVELFILDDYLGLLDVIPSVINEIVDIPGIDEDLEGKFLAINTKAMFEFIKYYAEKNK